MKPDVEEGAERERILEIQDGWFAMHRAPAMPGKLGNAARCKPLPKLPADGKLTICATDMRGLEAGKYCFALYSQHRCVTETPAVAFADEKFAHCEQPDRCESPPPEEVPGRDLAREAALAAGPVGVKAHISAPLGPKQASATEHLAEIQAAMAASKPVAAPRPHWEKPGSKGASASEHLANIQAAMPGASTLGAAPLPAASTGAAPAAPVPVIEEYPRHRGGPTPHAEERRLVQSATLGSPPGGGRAAERAVDASMVSPRPIHGWDGPSSSLLSAASEAAAEMGCFSRPPLLSAAQAGPPASPTGGLRETMAPAAAREGPSAPLARAASVSSGAEPEAGSTPLLDAGLSAEASEAGLRQMEAGLDEAGLGDTGGEEAGAGGESADYSMLDLVDSMA